MHACGAKLGRSSAIKGRNESVCSTISRVDAATVHLWHFAVHFVDNCVYEVGGLIHLERERERERERCYICILIESKELLVIL